ncbi:16S rRNA (guanine(966)-N(2))-methyltransferase RsmD [Pararhodobacter zhoushanensis]|uniref:16S rRNA (Guanine(966)-N(2))-methyltransferase RsmD n=1 Tax=Pararhodobacter zhoushanensis TaxID=2479545 RepID=A0ABT3GVI5_9RHOB|nr:16S rRNA (guanine(966)-N(2))-methyltransferase RsmD [Pararhodobacter zhoushanensis]MCW1931549.1 16S rRNA (guanine(966)-N(2))-methyltransferase RsmD [Pararhodobacter zhoushanensis]
MRIVGGTHRGLTLAEVGAGDAAAHLRPTSDRVREALFNMLTQGKWGDLVQGQRVLDLFAGTGALGLEALSRGASTVTLVDDGAAARALIRTNIEKLRAMGTTRLYRRNATDLGPNRGPAFGLIFLDPPYGMGLGAKALTSALTNDWIAPAATLVWEENAPQLAPQGFETLDQRRYGETWITLLRAPHPSSV